MSFRIRSSWPATTCVAWPLQAAVAICWAAQLDILVRYCYNAIMRAIPVADLKEVREDGSIVEVVIWLLPQAVAPSTHSFKYRLYFGKSGVCRVRYDNERGKGDHKHIGEVEQEYSFLSLEQLLADFKSDVENWS